MESRHRESIPGSTSAALMTLLAPIFWGTTYVTVTELLPADRPLLVATLRVLPAGVVLSLLGAPADGWRPVGREWANTVILALFNFGIFFPLLIVAVYRLPGGVAASFGGLQPLLVAMMAWLIGAAPARQRDLVIGVAAAIGVTLVVIRPGASFDAVGVAAAVGANISFSVGVVLTKRLPTPRSRLGATGWQLLLSAALLVPLAAVVEGRPSAPTATNLFGFAYLSLIATGLAFILWFGGIRRLPTQAPPLLGLAAPITGAALGWIIRSEDLTPLQVTGFIITIGAICYGAMLGTAKAATASRQELSTISNTARLPASVSS